MYIVSYGTHTGYYEQADENNQEGDNHEQRKD